ncbi:unnamed protein product, partial [marine sediment metagenome]
MTFFENFKEKFRVLFGEPVYISVWGKGRIQA